MDNQIKKIIITAGVIIIDNNKILLVKRPSNAKLFPNAWTFPGGKLEDGETLEQCAIRECIEETSIKLNKLVKYTFFEYESHFCKTISHLFFGNIDEYYEGNEFVSWFSLDSVRNLDIAFEYKDLIINLLVNNTTK